jgi:hypothetical protein
VPTLIFLLNYDHINFLFSFDLNYDSTTQGESFLLDPPLAENLNWYASPPVWVCSLAALPVLPCCAGRHIPLVVCSPHLFPLWGAIIPTLLLPVDAGIHALVTCQPPLHSGARNTVILALLWTIWKSRNRMTFDSNTLSTHTSSLC